jgi:hypothetical protein
MSVGNPVMCVECGVLHGNHQPSCGRQRLEAEVERLRVGFTRHLQDSNDCPITGVFCRPGCGCDVEMKDWVAWVPSGQVEDGSG